MSSGRRAAITALARPGRPGVITIAVAKGRNVPEYTARGILKQAGLSEDEFFYAYR
jgi:hypothetical protein